MSSNRPCPECGAEIAYAAKSCACGWGAGKKRHDAPPDYSCAAYGCPLDGSISPSTTGGGPWFCFLHYGIKADQRDAVTVKIRERAWLMRLMDRVYACFPNDWDASRPLAREYCEKHSRPDLGPIGDESKAIYFARLRAAMTIECQPPKQLPMADLDQPDEPSGMLGDFLQQEAA